MSTTEGQRTAFRTCPLCEAGCGLEITVTGGQVTRIRGDRDDVFSHGFICPKGSTLKQLHDDPDRLRRPLVKRDSTHVEVDWPEAWAAVAHGLTQVIDSYGRDAVGVYLGNPTAHSLGPLLFNRALLTGLGTRARFSASTVDQMPKQVAAAYMFGTPMSIPVPDLDRTDYLLLLGANPYASNGSLCTAPDFPGRIEAMRARGGSLVVVDPRRSRTAEEADRWVAIRPGADALFLMAIVNVLDADGTADAGRHVGPHVDGVATVRELCRPFTPEATAAATGVEPAVVREVARGLAAAPTAAVYGRIGTTTSGLGDAAFGTAASWLVDVVNVLSGNLDRPGGAMFARPAAGGPTTRGAAGGKGFAVGRSTSPVGGLPEVMGEYPVAALAGEIAGPGDGRLRAMVTVAGNPALSTPNAAQLDSALATLDFMVSVDIYVNETTRHADVILPPPSPLQRSHYDLALLQFAVRNVANYSAPVLPLDEGQPDEWEILARLAGIAQGLGPDADPALVDELAIDGLLRSAVKEASSPIHGRDVDEIRSIIDATGRRGPDRLLDVMLRTGPYGEGFGANPDGLTLDVLVAHPHGVDFGPLQPRIPDLLRTPSGRIELAPPELVAEVPRLRAAMDAATASAAASAADPVHGGQPLVLVGRRDLRSNNSWMHNLEVLVKGKAQCTLHVHPDDAAALGLVDGAPARVTSRVGTVNAAVEVTDAIRPGVVSLPHGWGHGVPGTRLRVAAERAGVNSNVLADHLAMDPLSGTSVLNGIPVEVTPV